MCFEGSKEFPNHLVNTLAHIIPLLVLPLLCVVCFESLDNQLYYCPLFLRVHGHKFHIPIQGRSYLISRDPAFLQHAPLAIPFPDAALLKAFLDSPIVDSLLPPTLQQASADPATDMTHKGKSVAQIALDAQKAAQHFMARIGVSSPPIFFQEVTGDSDVGTENSPIGSCSNTNVNDTEITTGPLLAKSGDPLRFYGWIINPQSHITNRFFLVLSGNKRYKLEVDPFLERKDVVRAMHSNHRDTYGFRASGILLNVAPGTYAVRLTTPADHGQVICTLPYQLVVAP